MLDRAFFVPLIRAALDYQESIDWLYGTQMFGIKLGLENTQRLLRELGIDPDSTAPKIVHVAGTNGKGSVCAFTEKILRDAGLRTGLFTSPHLVTYRERIRVCGTMISEQAVVEILETIREKVVSWDPHPTFFEISLCLAMRYFHDSECEAIVLETGMGGRLDATNALAATVSVITSVAMDHQKWLGGTLREIAAEKAGILKPNTPAIVADLHPDARDVVGRRALTLSIPYIEAHPLPEEWDLGLRGPHQRENAALAVEAACRIEGDRLTQEGIRQSLADTSWPGRFQILGDRVVLDGAHNPEAAGTLRETWSENFSEEKAHLVFGVAEGKDVVGIFRELLPVIGSVTFVPIRSERRLASKEMEAALLEAGGTSIPVDEADSLASALEGDGRILVAGSLFLVGEALGILEGRGFETSLQ